MIEEVVGFEQTVRMKEFGARYAFVPRIYVIQIVELGLKLLL